MKKSILGLFLIVLSLITVKAQTVIYSTTFGSSCSIPSGWSITSGTEFSFANNIPSSGYSTPNASGGCNLEATNAGSTYNEIIIPITTAGFSNIKLIFGGYYDGNFPGLTLDWGTDGSTFPNNISFDDVVDTDTWELITKYNFSASADNLPNLYIRISYSADGTGGFYYLDDFQVEGAAITTFYSKANSDLSQLTNWGTNSNGSGTNPANFTGSSQTFNITNSTSQTISSNWIVSGSTSKIIVKNGTTFTIPSTSSYTGTVDVEDNATLIINNTSIPTIGSLGTSSSSIWFNSPSTISVPARSDYVNLSLSGAALHNQGGNVTIGNNFYIGTGTTFAIGSNTLTLNGQIKGSGILRGSANSSISIGGTSGGNFGIINLSGTAAQRTFSNFTLNRLGSSASVSVIGGAIIGNTLSMTNGTFDIGSSTLTISNAISGIAGILSCGSASTVTYSKAGTQTIYPANYGILVISGSGTKTLGGVTTVAGNLNINSGTLAASTYSILLAGNFANLGTFSAGSGTVILNGTGAQAISGITTFNNLTITKPTSGAITITSGSNMQTIQGYLTINSLNGSNKLNTNGNLTLYSDQSTTASLIDNNSNSGSGGSVNGNIIVQRSYLGFATSTHIFGTPITSSTVFTLGQTPYNVLLYSEDGVAPYTRVTPSFNGSFRRVTLGGTNLTVGRGYSIRKDAPGTLNFTGVPNNGPIAINVTNTPGGVSPSGDVGYNMIANPYPSAINWATVNKGSTGVSNSGVSIWNGSTYTATANIPSGVGFFVQANTSGTITFNNTDRVGSGTVNNTVYRTEEESKWFYLNVENATGGPQDAFAVTFDNNATNGFDSDYDIVKPYVASGPFIYSRVGGKRLSLSVAPYPDDEVRIPVTLHVYANATYRFTTSSFSDWYSDYAVFLVDSTSSGKQIIDLSTISNYDFIKNTADTDTSSRFSLIFKYQPGVNTTTTGGVNTSPGGNTGTFTGSPLLLVGVPDDELFIEVINTAPGITAIDTKEADEELSSKVYSVGTNVYINFGTNLSKSDIVIYDLLGRIIYESTDVDSKGKIIIPMWQATRSSVYIVKLRNNRELITKRMIFN